MQVETLCRCCLSEGIHKDLNSTYIWFNKKEIYADMLSDCFNIVLDTSNSSKICDVCVKDLRRAVDFKQQVLKSDAEFMKRLGGNLNDVSDEKPVKIKLEPTGDSGDDSDDYFLADAVKETSFEKIKQEAECTNEKPAPKRTKKSAKASTDDSVKWRNDKIKSLVNKLASISSISVTRNNPELTLPKKTKKDKTRGKISIPKDYSEKKVNIIWTARTTNDKTKHRDNLQTILKFSNATPFKNKSLLGFICGYCPATYPDPMDLRLHTEADHSKQRLEFKSNFDMSEYNVKLDVTDLTCTLCDEKFDNLTTLKEHLVKIHGKTFYDDVKDHIVQYKLKKGDVYDCALCTSTYETFKMLKQHMNKHYSNYNCNKCDASFATKRSLHSHSGTHLEGNFKCSYCEKIFASKQKKQSHEKISHLGATNIANCPYCNESFTSYYQRNQHLVKVHNGEAQYKCNICNKSYILKSLLMYHIKKNHLMERDCQCTECGFRFFSKKALKAHMVKHTGEKIFTCEVCNKSYARKYTLREHMRIHNNDRRFKCEICAMTFVQKCSLKSHLLSNHGISMAASDISSSQLQNLP